MIDTIRENELDGECRLMIYDEKIEKFRDEDFAFAKEIEKLCTKKYPSIHFYKWSCPKDLIISDFETRRKMDIEFRKFAKKMSGMLRPIFIKQQAELQGGER